MVLESDARLRDAEIAAISILDGQIIGLEVRWRNDGRPFDR